MRVQGAPTPNLATPAAKANQAAPGWDALLAAVLPATAIVEAPSNPATPTARTADPAPAIAAHPEFAVPPASPPLADERLAAGRHDLPSPNVRAEDLPGAVGSLMVANPTEFPSCDLGSVATDNDAGFGRVPEPALPAPPSLPPLVTATSGMTAIPGPFAAPAATCPSLVEDSPTSLPSSPPVRQQPTVATPTAPAGLLPEATPALPPSPGLLALPRSPMLTLPEMHQASTAPVAEIPIQQPTAAPAVPSSPPPASATGQASTPQPPPLPPATATDDAAPSVPWRADPGMGDALPGHALSQVRPPSVALPGNADPKPANHGNALLYPQRLMAHGHLSQLGTGGMAGSPRLGHHDMPATPTAPPAGLVLAALPTLAPLTLPGNATTPAAGAEAATEASRDATNETEDSVLTRSQRGRPLLVALPWAPKLLRLAVDAEGGVNVWVRDFALDGDAVKQLVQAVRRAAENDASPLQRIHVNGQLAWSSAQGTP